MLVKPPGGLGCDFSGVQADNAVERARAQLQEAANSNNLAALDAAIAHGESVLSAIRTAGAPARTQSLAMTSSSPDIQKWRSRAEQAAAKVERLEGIQQRARAEAAQAKRAEEEWMHKAQQARSKAKKLAERRSDNMDSLEGQKRALKARLEANEEKIQRVEAMESSDEDRAAKRAALEEQVPVYPSHTDTLRQMYGAGRNFADHKVQELEGELERQIREYKDAREMMSHESAEDKQRAKEKQLMDEINHIKQARLALIHSHPAGSRRRVQRAPALGREMSEKARLLAKERKINEEIASLDGVGASGGAAEEEDYEPKVDNEMSRALQDQEEMPDFESYKSSRGTSQLAKGHMHKKHISVLQGFESALGDSKEDAKAAMKTVAMPTHAAAQGRLPGVNSYSWWSEKSAKVAAKKAQLAAIRNRIRQETHKQVAKSNCHNLYSCIGSMFSGVEDSSKLSRANSAVMQQQLQMQLAQPKTRSSSHLAADHDVSTHAVLRNPQAPLLGLLAGSTHTHTHKLPGVVESRWGGSKFFDRLFGSPATQHGVPLKRVHDKPHLA